MEDLYFEGRALKPYGEYVPNDQLIIGRVYFKLGFLDEDMVVPQMHPMVFIGRDLHEQLPGLYFQDVESYFDGVRLKPEECVGADDLEDEQADGRQWICDDYQFEWQRHRMSRQGPTPRAQRSLRWL
jgi:hypothetical protein